MSSQHRGSFNSRFTVIMSMAGSAIGLGNMWRFPYMVGQHGGAAFIILYILCSLFIALPIFFSESIIGKYGGSSTYEALEKISPQGKWKYTGFLVSFSCFVIVSFYCVVGGWSLDFLFRSLSGSLASPGGQATSVFQSMTSTVWEPLLMLTLFMGITALIVSKGVDKGIGAFSKLMMPILFIIIILIVIRSCTLPGAKAGIDYLVRPDFSKIDGPAIAAALGQSFFSLSLGVGCILTYSSYMKKEEHIFHTGIWTAVFDTCFAVLAGFAIMPAVFASGLEPSAGPSLVYEILPVIFAKMGVVVPVIFFLALLIAALTSSISMMEVCVALLIDHAGWGRRSSTAVVFALSLVLSCLCSIFPKLFNICDFATSNILMMTGAFIFAIVTGWVMSREDAHRQFTNYGTSRKASAVFPAVWFLIRWVAPVMIVVIAITNLL